MRSFHLAGVMGWPIHHSRSPVLHGYWLKQLSLPGAYVPLAVRPETLETALRGLAALGFAGCNLTIPLKEAALKRVDRLDETARRIGAVNTVVVEQYGSLFGLNTDSFGFAASLRASVPRLDLAGRTAAVIGAGGAARAVIDALLTEGVGTIRVANRTPERVQSLVSDFGPAIEAVAWEQRSEALRDVALIVNTSSLGMTGQPPLDLALEPSPGDAIVADIVYTPLQTDLLRAARARGHAAVDGLGMLLHQARPAFAAWFGPMPEVTPELRQLVEATL